MNDDFDLGKTIVGLAVGQRVFGRYTLKQIVGRGGMGVVWRARDDELEQDIALKFLPDAVATDGAALDDLRRETRRSRELTHPHIVRIHDFVRDERMAAISMEFVDGDTLSNLRLTRPNKVFEAAELLPWVKQLCEALDYAHTKAQVVHRDLKPANLMIDARGDLKIADFGISATISDTATRVSKVSGTSGTPVYMSPQQMMGEKPAASDDIYSLGATLYELLTGKPPFYTGRIEMQVMNKVPPSVAGRRQELGVTGQAVSPAWEETIMALLAKEPSARPQSAGEVVARIASVRTQATMPIANAAGGDSVELRQIKPEAQVAAPPAPAPQPAPAVHKPAESWKPILALSVVGVLALAAVTYFAMERSPAPRGTAAAPAIAEKSPLSKSFFTEGKRATIPDLNLTMVPIASGTFAMGSETGSSNEQPVTRVTLTKPYWLGATEVAQQQYEAVMGRNPSQFKGENLPVENVTWTDAMEFCRKLTERERAAGRLPSGYVYTLPSEAQWEYACRAGTTGDYAGDLDAMGWYDSNSGNRKYRVATHQVATKQANAWGLYDMHGNVWEWCADWYGGYAGGSVTDPRGPASGSYRVHRGGSWVNTADRCRSALRDWDEPGFRGLLGFRLSLSSVP